MFSGIASRWLATLTTILTGYVLMPFLVGHLGQEGYGIWSLIAGITNAIGLLLLGAPLASLRYLCVAVANNDEDDANRILGSSFGLYLILAALGLVAGVLLYRFFGRYPIPAESQASARQAYAVGVFACALGFLSRLPMAIFSAHGDFAVQSRITIAADVIRVACTMLFVLHGDPLVGVALGQLAGVVSELALFALVTGRRYPAITVSLRFFRAAVVRRMLYFSLPVMLVGVGGYLSFQTDPLVIGVVLPVSDIPHYLVGSRLIAMLLGFAQAMAAVVTPTAAKLHARAETVELTALLLRWGTYASWLSVAALGALAVAGPSLVSWWIGPEFKASSVIVLDILAMGYLICMPAQCVAYPVLVATGRVGAAGAAFVAAGIVNIILSLVLGHRLGLAGVALGTAIPMTAYGIFLQSLACRQVGVSLPRYFMHTLLWPFFGLVPAVRVIWKRSLRIAQ